MDQPLVLEDRPEREEPGAALRPSTRPLAKLAILEFETNTTSDFDQEIEEERRIRAGEIDALMRGGLSSVSV